MGSKRHFRYIQNALAVLGLLAIFAGAYFVMTLEEPRACTEIGSATVQQCGYGMRCDAPRCYRGRR